MSRLRERTAGNPFYIEETLHGVRDLAELRDEDPRPGLVLQAVPSGIEALIRRRLARLDPRTRAVLGAAAVAGREFGVELLAALGDWSAPEVSDALQEAIRDGIVVEVPGRMDRFAFRHALVRMTLYADQPPSRRMELHARCGEALEASGARAAELAHHFFAARHAGLRRARRCATRSPPRSGRPTRSPSRRRSRTATARSSSSPPRGRSATPSAATCCSPAGGRCGAPARRRRRSGRSWPPPSWPARSAIPGASRAPRSATGAATTTRARRSRSSSRCSRRRSSGSGEADSGARARVLAGLADALHFREPPERVQAYSREAVAMARRLGDDDALAVALAGLHGALLHTAYLEERLPIGLELLALVGQGRPGEHGATALHWRLYDLFEAGDIGDGAARARAARSSSPSGSASRSTATSPPPGRRSGSQTAGRFAEAEEQARRSLDFARRAHMPYAESNHAGQLFGLRRDQGTLDALAAEVRGSIGDRPRLPVWRAGMVLAHLDAGDAGARPRGLRGARGRRLRGDPAPTSSGSARCAC